MATYKDSGVDIDLGDKCSAIAYTAAKNTFKGRAGMLGQPVTEDGGFTGLLDMGEYYLVQNDDGVGTKIDIAQHLEKFDTLGYDLVAMVADDAACIGAETISISNTLDVNNLNEKWVQGLMGGLEKAALEHKIVIPGGEIAELGNSLNSWVWNATAVGVVDKDKVITGEKIQAGDKIIGLKSDGFRSNGFSLVRYVLKEKFGKDWPNEKYDQNKTWGEVVLTPSRIYSSLIMDLHGRHKETPKAELKGIVHVTGGGIQGNLDRLLKKTAFKADLNALPTPHEPMQRLIEFGNIPKEEAYRTWNMGVGMILVSNDVEKIEEACKTHGIEMSVIGEVV
ncbi:phosphoribosylformylglycinamidine cyclo-ligase [Patescibacteria group bacterium]|nr:phosphoribosylformylglycinamidine cyclo-ligase [Patescibacteria group bacterium]